jgi:hypothetical protein
MLDQETAEDGKVYDCKVHRFVKVEENLDLILERGNLQDITLDGIYACRIDGEGESLLCTGRIRNRYNSAQGKMLEFHVVDGFYKNNQK